MTAGEGQLWSRSGGAWLTGAADGPPLAAPGGLAQLVIDSHHRLTAGAARWGDTVAVEGIDPMALLGERAALAGLERRGQRSCGGATSMLRAADGWIAVSFARPDDIELVPAWLGEGPSRSMGEPSHLDVEWLASMVAGRAVTELTERAALVGMAVGGLGETAPDPFGAVRTLLRRPGSTRSAPPLVVDLSSLWAGPLCSHLLMLSGARVLKVESWQRPDGMRRDPSGLFDLLTAGKQCVAFDAASLSDRRWLTRLLEVADVVIEGSRPRALAHLGIDATAIVRASDAKVWLSITAYGRTGDPGMRVGFGDDTAVAGGLVAWAGADEPCFLADAVADPITGVVAAGAVAAALADGGQWLLDVALARVAAVASRGVERPTPPAVGDASSPRARPGRGAASALGADTDEVRAEVARR